MKIQFTENNKQLNKNEYLEYIKQWEEKHKEEIFNNKCKHIFLECLPKNNNKSKNIDWRNSVGYSLKFIYGDIQEFITIEDYIKNKKIKLKIGYKEKSLLIDPQKLKMCQLGKLLNKKTSTFKVKIGQTFKDDKRDLTIIDKKIEKKNYVKKDGSKNNCNFKHYKFHCTKCGAELWTEESNLLKGIGCGCCSNQITVKGINDIATTHPNLVKYFVNVEDAYTCTYASNQKVLCKCPDCGTEKKIIVSDLYFKGFSCSKCSDGISYPNKFMFNILEQLNLEFETEYSPNWIKPKRYDFYIPSKNLVIEMDGELGHKNGKIHSKSKKSLEECILIDKYKEYKAKENGLQIIRIDCFYKHYDKYEYIKNSVLYSKLNEVFDLSKINWAKVGQDSEKNLVKEVCDYWNHLNNAKLISERFKLDRSTVLEYLKRGTLYSWCNYDAEKERKKNLLKTIQINKKNTKPIKMLKDNILIGVFISGHELDRLSLDIFDTHLDFRCISSVCNKKLNQYKGFTFHHITKEEFYDSIDNQNDTYKLYT